MNSHLSQKSSPSLAVTLFLLCERKTSPASFAIVLFLTEEHRRTEHTNFHRDIKSTDFTERYSHL